MVRLADNPVLAALHADLPRIIRARHAAAARKQRQRKRDRAAGLRTDEQAAAARKPQVTT